MGKFAHMSDVHLGAHREPALRQLERKSFNEAMDRCIELGVDFLVISGDLFHVGIPDLGVVNEAVRKMREVERAGIPIYAIYGSHDYNPASTSVIDIIETAGILTNISKWEEVEGRVRLRVFKDRKTGAKLTGISARKMGLESKHYERLDRESLEREEGFRVFAFHSGITEFKPPHLSEMDTIPISYLPSGFDYYAGGHIHERGEFSEPPGYERVVFPGPLFTGYGRDVEATARGEARGFYVVGFDERVTDVRFVRVKGFDGAYLEYDAGGKNSVQAARELQDALLGLEVGGRVVALKVRGELSGGRTSDINFAGLRAGLVDRGAIYVYLNRYGLVSKEYSSARFVGEDTAAIEGKSFRERIGEVKVSQPNLKGDSGVASATELLMALRHEAKPDESKRTYQERAVREGIAVLKLKRVMEPGP